MDGSRLGTPVRPTKKLAVYSYGMLLHFFHFRRPSLPVVFALFTSVSWLSVGRACRVRVFFRILIQY